jgi:thioredoxin-like negative regulator of GroEL
LPDLAPDELTTANALLAEAYLAAGQPENALTSSEAFAAAQDPRLILLRANTLAGAGRWADALPLYRQLTTVPEPSLAARLGEAESLHALGQTGRASELLERLVRKGNAPVAVQLRHAHLLVELRQEKRGWAALKAIKPVTPEEKKWQHYIEGGSRCCRIARRGKARLRGGAAGRVASL